MALIKASYLSYKEAFHTTEDISAFKNVLKEKGANSNYRMGVQFKGKSTHSAVALKVDLLHRDLQRRLVRTVSLENISYYFFFRQFPPVWYNAQ